MIIPISEAKAKLSELVAMSDDEEVTLLKHGHPAAVLVSANRWEEIRELIEDLEDLAAIKERADEPRVDLSEFINRSARSA